MESCDWCFSILFICIAITLCVKHMSRSYAWKLYYKSLDKNRYNYNKIEKPYFD